MLLLNLKIIQLSSTADCRSQFRGQVRVRASSGEATPAKRLKLKRRESPPFNSGEAMTALLSPEASAKIKDCISLFHPRPDSDGVCFLTSQLPHFSFEMPSSSNVPDKRRLCSYRATTIGHDQQPSKAPSFTETRLESLWNVSRATR